MKRAMKIILAFTLVFLSTQIALPEPECIEITYEWEKSKLLGPRMIEVNGSGTEMYADGTYGLKGIWKELENGVYKRNAISHTIDNVDIWATNNGSALGDNPDVHIYWCLGVTQHQNSIVSSLRDGFHTYYSPDEENTMVGNQLTEEITFVYPN